ncbi:MAG: hypothetical protein J6S09_04010 [Paludibacteraceae bacterium]|nr:hypothetical protein [Paludibacteraceae bacterium]
MNNNLKTLYQLFKKIHSFENDNSGYSLGKSTILKVFKATNNYTQEDLLARLTLIDSMYSTQMGRRYYGLEELAAALLSVHSKKHIKSAFLDFLKDKDMKPFELGKKTNLFTEKYGIGKNGEDKGGAVSLISKYAYFETEFKFPIYDSIVREMYPRIWNYCGFPKSEMLEFKYNDMTSFVEMINLMISKLNSTYVNYDSLDRILWYVGKIYRGNLSLVLSREEYDAFAEKYTKTEDGKKVFAFDIATVDLKSLPVKKDSLIYDFFALAKELKEFDNKK